MADDTGTPELRPQLAQEILKFEPHERLMGLMVLFYFLLFALFCLAGFVGGVPELFPVKADTAADSALGVLPRLEFSGTARPTTPAASVATPSTALAPVAATPTQPAPQQPQSQTPTPTQPTPTQPPPPPPTCGFGGPISVAGGSPGSVGPSGGSFTVASTPVILSVSLPVCGGHYRLAFSGTGPGGAFYNGSDCKFDGFNLDVTALTGGATKVGDNVNVTLQLPPNACG